MKKYFALDPVVGARRTPMERPPSVAESTGRAIFHTKEANRVSTAAAGSKVRRVTVESVQSQPSYVLYQFASVCLPFPQGRHVPAPPFDRVSSRGTNHRVEGGPHPLPYQSLSGRRRMREFRASRWRNRQSCCKAVVTVTSRDPLAAPSARGRSVTECRGRGPPYVP